MYECRTISGMVTEVIFKEKGSKFLGYAFRINHEGDAKSNLEWVKQEHPSATHHCYAYRVGFSGKKYRANDDGEPNGTAGLPIYNQLLSRDLTFVLVVVVRYYGGTKLGVSGLIKAYKSCAELTLDEAKVVSVHKTERYILNFPYSEQSNVMRLIDIYNCDLITQTYMEDCEIEVEIRKKNSKKFLEQLEAFPKIEVYACD